MTAAWQWFVKNWRTNLTALVAIIYSAQQFTVAVQAWENGQPANWRTAVVSLIVSAGLFAARDNSNVPTQTEVNKATVKADDAAQK